VELLDAAHALDRLFPGCSFIHVVRDPEENIAALVSAPASDGEYYSPDAARRAWIAAVEKGLLLEEALGQRVRRIEWEALRQSPEASVASCLDFIGEAATPACNRPFADVPRPDPADALRGETTAATAAVLVRLQETGPTRTGNQEARKRLAEAFRRGHQPNGSTKSVLERLRALVEGAVPEGSGVAVVSRGDDRLMDFVGRRAWHLPQVEGGVYAGHHPSDDVEALDHLGRLCERGADHLVIPAPSLWWLTFYEGLRQHLEERATLVAFHEATGAVFRLRRIDPQAVAGKPVPARFIPVSPTPGRRQAS
jgi:hypothetical protein